jgi:Zn finger protein HypA/HybF involved in hydrogenase expression
LPSLIEFVNQHPTEDDCWHYLPEQRWGDDGFECPDCGEDEHRDPIETCNLFECYACHKQTSITAGTILQVTKLDL